MGKHYLYRHIRLDKNEPFYIGIGTKPKKAIRTHEGEYSRAYAKGKSNRGNYWRRIVAKTNYEVEILMESDDYEFIKQKEIEFIALYGRENKGTGTLCNLTDGGDGVIGRIISEETREKMSKAAKGKTVSEETKLKISLHNIGKTWSEEKRAAHEKSIPRGENHHGVRILLNTQTGIFYYTIAEAAHCNNLTKSALTNMLYGTSRHTSPVIYAESEGDGHYPVIPKIKPYSPYVPTEKDRKKTSLRSKGKVGVNSSNPKKVVNIETGELYGCTKIVTEKYNYNYSYFCNRLNPNHAKRNNTPFEYYDEQKHKHLLK